MKKCLFPLALVLAVPAAAQDYYGDVRPLVQKHCLGCHAASSLSFSFEDPEFTYTLGPAIVSAATERRMPPWLAEPGHQQYVDDPSLGEDELRMLRSWAAAGFPKGESRPDHGAAASVASTFKPDLGLDVLPGRAYLPNQARKDDYRCFVLDWPLDKPAYITGFRALPGNLRVAHHLVVFAVQPELVARFKALEDEEDGHGYQCFGGAVPDRLGKPDARAAYDAKYPDGVRELNRGSFWLAHWAPGMDGYAFPAGTGIPMKPGMAVVVQMHYYSAFAPGEGDEGSRMEFTVAHHVDKPALHVPVTRFQWTDAADNGSMVIPPGQRTRYEAAYDFEALSGYIGRHIGLDESQIAALEVHSANLHMHSFGAAGTISLTDRHGHKETLLRVPRWDLNWQRDFTFVSPKRTPRSAFKQTRLAVECEFENATDQPVLGGYGSDEEMCFNFSYVAVVKDTAAGEPVARR
ncbi:MAG TPA: hypothetical protein PKZ76_17515 [Xanthomonadaceae bacterium]|nr:hypothetical protein [Xanthomonadaceae bacterium]